MQVGMLDVIVSVIPNVMLLQCSTISGEIKYTVIIINELVEGTTLTAMPSIGNVDE